MKTVPKPTLPVGLIFLAVVHILFSIAMVIAIAFTGAKSYVLDFYTQAGLVAYVIVTCFLMLGMLRAVFRQYEFKMQNFIQIEIRKLDPDHPLS